MQKPLERQLTCCKKINLLGEEALERLVWMYYKYTQWVSYKYIQRTSCTQALCFCFVITPFHISFTTLDRAIFYIIIKYVLSSIYFSLKITFSSPVACVARVSFSVSQ